MLYKPTTQQPTIKDTEGFTIPFSDEKSTIRKYHLSVVKSKKSIKEKAKKEMRNYRRTQKTTTPPRSKPLPRRRPSGMPTLKRATKKRLQKIPQLRRPQPPKFKRTQKRNPLASA